jgi:thioredoxin 1
MDDLARLYRGRIKVTRFKVDENPVISSKYSVLSIPMLLIFKKGDHLDTMTGAPPDMRLRGV